MNEEITIILKKMCDIINVDINTIDFKEPRWFEKHSWTITQEREFFHWLIDYLETNKNARKNICRFPNQKGKEYLAKVAAKFISQYGWTYKEN